MKIAIFSDIHGNKEALEAILNDIKKEDIDEIICLGDVIAIGPNSKECMDLIISNNIKIVLGNNELYFLKGTYIDDEMDEGKIKHQQWIKEQLNNRHREYLNKSKMFIERVYNDKKVLFTHFPININSEDEYPFYDLNIVKNGEINNIVDNLKYDLIFIGHEHQEFNINNKLYDIGSSGCRKDNITKYTIFDTNTFDISTRQLQYDRKKFIDSILSYEYPERNLIAKLFFGIDIK